MTYNLQTLRGDLFGGITAAVVGLPVALAFGVASGLGALAGIYGAIAVGFFAAVFGGTRSQISGPTGPMAVAMAVIVTTHADTLAEAFTIVIMAGLIQILLGVMRIGRFVAFTPYSVISGFMSGIGIIIMLLQTLPFLGATGATGGPVGVIRALPNAMNNVNLQCARHCRRDARGRRAVAPAIAEIFSTHVGGPRCRYAARRAVVDEHAGHWRGSYRFAAN